MKPATIVNPYAKKPPPTSNSTTAAATSAGSSRHGGSSFQQTTRCQQQQPPTVVAAPAAAAGNNIDHLLAGKRIVVHAASFSQAFESIVVPNHTTTTTTTRQQQQQHSTTTTGNLDSVALNRAAQDNIDALTSQAEAAGTGNSNSNNNNMMTDRESHVLLQQPHVLYVSTKQRGNGLLQYIRNVPYAYSRMVPDYVMSPTQCALFLSIKYHSLYPNYIHRRIAELKQDFSLRILLCFVDVQDNAHILRVLNKLAVTNNLTLILAWSEEEAARYLETYKAFSGRDATLIQRKESTHFADQVADFLSAATHNHRTVVNKTDAATLLSQFNSVRAMAAASMDELGLVSGMGQVKVKRLHDAFHKPFSKKRAKLRKKQKQQQQQQESALDSASPGKETKANDNATYENSSVGAGKRSATIVANENGQSESSSSGTKTGSSPAVQQENQPENEAL